MTFKDYWEDLMKKRPIKDGQVVKMSKEQFYNMQLRAFRKGAFSILNKANESKDISPVDKIFKDMDEILKYLFGEK